MPTKGAVTHVSALSDQFSLLTSEIKITCITIAQFTGIGYIRFGNVKQNGVTSFYLLPDLEKGVGNGLDCLNTNSVFRIPHTWWGRRLARVGEELPSKKARRH